MTDLRSLISAPPFSGRLSVSSSNASAPQFSGADAFFCESESLGVYKRIKELGGAGIDSVCFECPKTAFESPIAIPSGKKIVAAIMTGERLRRFSENLISSENGLIALLTDYDLVSVFSKSDIVLGKNGKSVSYGRIPDKIAIILDMPYSKKRGLFADAFSSAASLVYLRLETSLSAVSGKAYDKEITDGIDEILSTLVSAREGEETDAVFKAQLLYAKLVYEHPTVYYSDARVAAKILKRMGVSASTGECEYLSAKALSELLKTVCISVPANNGLFPKFSERADALTALYGAKEDAFIKDIKPFDEPNIYAVMSSICDNARAKEICLDAISTVSALDRVYARIYGGRRKRAEVSRAGVVSAIKGAGLLSEGLLKVLSDGGVLDVL